MNDILLLIISLILIGLGPILMKYISLLIMSHDKDVVYLENPLLLHQLPNLSHIHLKTRTLKPRQIYKKLKKGRIDLAIMTSMPQFTNQYLDLFVEKREIKIEQSPIYNTIYLVYFNKNSYQIFDIRY